MPLAPATRLGPYEILVPLGAGGMGEVYRARDTRLDRSVAIKILPTQCSADPSRKQRFEREAKAISSLNHPNICILHDIGHQNGIDYLVMEYLQGEPLSERLATGPLPEDQALQTAMEIADALRAAHAQGIIHRDLKPGNIMLTASGAKLMDFGLARLSVEEAGAAGRDSLTVSHTRTGVAGTAAYMSPEQARAEAIDGRSDIFSFGIVLFEMLTGVHPWRHQTAIDVLHAILHEEHPELPVGLGRRTDLEQILGKALKKTAAERYATASDLLADLRAASSGQGAVVETEKAIGVPPFVFLTAVEDKESLSLGFADALITTLGRVEGLRVPPTAAIVRYAGENDPQRISRELGVRYVLQGSIQRLGDQWRVSIQVLDAQARKTVFSEKYDFKLSHVFEVQDEIARQVAEALLQRFQVGNLKSRQRYSSDSRAYGAYLHGLDASYSEAPENVDLAIRCFTEAIERDPHFALAHAMLAHASSSRYFGYEPRYKWLQLAEKHCARALQLDSQLPEAIMARAYLLWTPQKNFPHFEAIRELRKAIAMQPNLDHAYNRLGTILAHIGQLRASQEAFMTARRINPQNFGNTNLIQCYVWGGQYARAAQELETCRRLRPTNKYYLWFRPQPALLLGELENAAKWAGEAVEAYPDEPMMVSLQGLVQARLGRKDLARLAAERACASPHSFGHTHHAHYQIACIYAVLGETQLAMHWLERAVAGGFPCWPFFLRDPNLEELRGLPDFQELVAGLRSEFPSSAGPEAQGAA